MSTRQYNFVRGVVVTAVMMGVIIAGWYGFMRFGSETVNLNPTQKSADEVSPDEVIARTLTFGNTYWGGAIDDVSKGQGNSVSYPFSGLSSFSRQNYDAWIAHMECALSDLPASTAVQNDSQLFSCPTSYLAEASKWFSLVSLATEHTDDQGEDGVAFTRKLFGEKGIQVFGSSDPTSSSDACEVVALPSRTKLMDGSFKSTMFPFGFCSVNLVGAQPNDVLQSEISKYSRLMPVWVFPHMGIETTIEPSAEQQELYRSYIDAGADVVIGSHPRRVQRAEAYKGKLIMYSLGNFMFNQGLRGVEEQRGVGVAITATIPVTQSNTGWTLLACREFKDTCFDQAETLSLTKPKVSYTYDIVSTDNSNDGVPKLASSAWQKDNLERLNWVQVKAALTQ